MDSDYKRKKAWEIRFWTFHKQCESKDGSSISQPWSLHLNEREHVLGGSGGSSSAPVPCGNASHVFPDKRVEEVFLFNQRKNGLRCIPTTTTASAAPAQTTPLVASFSFKSEKKVLLERP